MGGKRKGLIALLAPYLFKSCDFVIKIQNSPLCIGSLAVLAPRPLLT